MKQLFALLAFVVFSVNANAQLKKDGTPDMRYKANKEMYGNSYSSPSYSSPSYSSPSYSSPSYSPPKRERNYDNGGSLRVQDGYMKSNGTYVAPHVKSRPDNNTYNNYNSYKSGY
ncbi:hypothetical protein ACF3NR_02280 [Vaginella massiliensis]|uniref:hypothetical protein n=1 Tax=Vaginella massiliensis TaxID=1816680 RepID=UPI003752BEC3